MKKVMKKILLLFILSLMTPNIFSMKYTKALFGNVDPSMVLDLASQVKNMTLGENVDWDNGWDGIEDDLNALLKAGRYNDIKGYYYKNLPIKHFRDNSKACRWLEDRAFKEGHVFAAYMIARYCLGDQRKNAPSSSEFSLGIRAMVLCLVKTVLDIAVTIGQKHDHGNIKFNLCGENSPYHVMKDKFQEYLKRFRRKFRQAYYNCPENEHGNYTKYHEFLVNSSLEVFKSIPLASPFWCVSFAKTYLSTFEFQTPPTDLMTKKLDSSKVNGYRTKYTTHIVDALRGFDGNDYIKHFLGINLLGFILNPMS